MAYLESPDIFRERMRPVFNQGVQDYKSAHGVAKLISGVGGSAGAIIGAVISVPKGAATAAYDYYDYSVGQSRGRGIYDYMTNSPVVETLATGLACAGIGAALNALGLQLPWYLALQTTFLGGIGTYLGGKALFGVAKAAGASTIGCIGIGLSKGRQLVDGKKPAVVRQMPVERDAA